MFQVQVQVLVLVVVDELFEEIHDTLVLVAVGVVGGRAFGEARAGAGGGGAGTGENLAAAAGAFVEDGGVNVGDDEVVSAVKVECSGGAERQRVELGLSKFGYVYVS